DSLVWADLSSEPDLSLYYSRAWLDFSLAYLEKQKLTFNQEIIEKKTCFSGFPEIDQIKLVNPYEIKKRWGIPEEQKVLLFLPFTFGSTNDRFWARFIYGNDLSFLKPLFGIFSFKRKFFQQIFKGENDLMFCRLLKDFCQRNDVFLLVKSRRKDLVKPYLSKLADKVLYDEQEYPSTIIECFAVANLCLNFLSTAVLESVALGCPNISVLPSNGYKDIQNPLWELLLNKYRDIFDFKGVSQLISLRDVFLLLKEKNLNDFTLNKQAQEEYLKKYIGSKDPSKKAIDAIEKLAMKQSRT
ncbi:hypothetical protein FJ208_00800, partial [Candidatus Gribaldobacteria bacterium]|nr:hypothetical protein [Candidatus Gribaldobacteria bacterium]